MSLLVLSRKELESIRIGNDVNVTVVKIKGGKVQISIEAPPQVPIIRQELLERDG